MVAVVAAVAVVTVVVVIVVIVVAVVAIVVAVSRHSMNVDISSERKHDFLETRTVFFYQSESFNEITR